MKINAEFDQRVVVHSQEMEWVESPMPGVSRRALDRVGGEVARATTIVKYEPNSHFSPHVHTGGEEFIVLSGVFQDEHGDFPAGSYIRNPPESKHKPGSDDGCVIFVKLWQFQPEDRTHVRLNMNYMQTIPHKAFEGISFAPLYNDEYEDVVVMDFDANAELNLDVKNGAEILVLEGEVKEGDDLLVQHSWLRVPQNEKIQAKAGGKGAKVWMKTRHLDRVDQEITRVTNA
ncbi:cupin domain-containing protein [Agarilytica rhodophyticola]|uniref:cupin domain-containing protein n=1 Tax=Agarilytica rhodophyticola TaxID=1737490 RepID=UPI000B343EB4|nr:cupin domain-containing protein [Agarilytica rhodophyticola]